MPTRRLLIHLHYFELKTEIGGEYFYFSNESFIDKILKQMQVIHDSTLLMDR